MRNIKHFDLALVIRPNRNGGVPGDCWYESILDLIQLTTDSDESRQLTWLHIRNLIVNSILCSQNLPNITHILQQNGETLKDFVAKHLVWFGLMSSRKPQKTSIQDQSWEFWIRIVLDGPTDWQIDIYLLVADKNELMSLSFLYFCTLQFGLTVPMNLCAKSWVDCSINDGSQMYILLYALVRDLPALHLSGCCI